MQYLRVENLTSPKSGNPVPNQFAIHTGVGIYFQGYNTLIAFVPRNARDQIIFDINSWDYSRTTSKYLRAFVDRFANVPSYKNLRQLAKSEHVTLQDLN